MHLRPQRHVMLLACLLATPVLGLASSIVVNGTSCEAGTCPPVDTLAPGSSIPSTLFSFTASVNGDPYHIFGDYSASNTTDTSTGFTFTQIDVTAQYIGITPIAQSDVLVVHDLQDFTVPGGFDLDGIYDLDGFAGFGGTGASSSLQMDGLYNGDGPSLLFTSTGFQSSSKSLTGLTGPIDVDFKFTFTFGDGSTTGSYITTVVPEPGGAIPIAVLLALCLGVPAIRRSSVVSKNVCS